LYADEVDSSGQQFRWTGPSALLQFEPAEGVTHLDLEFVASQPIRTGVPTTIRVQAAGQTFTFLCNEAEWQKLSVRLRPADAGDQLQPVTVRINVTPTMVPAELSDSDDTRVLGTMLRPPRFSG
jgi:hypothetical protein